MGKAFKRQLEFPKRVWQLPLHCSTNVFFFILFLSTYRKFVSFYTPERVRVPLEAGADGLLPQLLVVEVVVAVVAVAAVAELAVGEAVAVQLEALRLRAVARAPRPQP